jgi:AraC-like DNA-binding protein
VLEREGIETTLLAARPANTVELSSRILGKGGTVGMSRLRMKNSHSIRAALNSTRTQNAVSNNGAKSRHDFGPGPDIGAGLPLSRVPEVRIRRILEMIESDSSCKISDLALELNLSESRLQHLFKQKTGVGLGHLLTEKRLQKAAVLLAHSNLRIKEIAAAVGYEHTSSFTRAFEQRFAQSPNVYRRETTAGNINGCQDP